MAEGGGEQDLHINCSWTLENLFNDITSLIGAMQIRGRIVTEDETTTTTFQMQFLGSGVSGWVFHGEKGQW